jgi:mono/diheme cytochrome c family protein
MVNKLAILFVVLLALVYTSCKNKTYSQGERLYKAHCANCHMEDGTGLAKLIPPLANSDYLKLNQESIPCIILKGQSGEIVVNGVTYDQQMPGQKYTEIQINNMINYINTAWNNDIAPVTIPETVERLKDCNK